MNLKRQELLQRALKMTDAALERSPGMPALISIRNQLEYLRDLDAGKRNDRHLIARITLGALAARELGPDQLVDILFEVMMEVRAMSHGH